MTKRRKNNTKDKKKTVTKNNYHEYTAEKLCVPFMNSPFIKCVFIILESPDLIKLYFQKIRKEGELYEIAKNILEPPINEKQLHNLVLYMARDILTLVGEKQTYSGGEVLQALVS